MNQRPVSVKHLLNILHLEDNDGDAELVRSTLEADDIAFTLTRVYTKQDFLDALARQRFDIIVSDYAMPTFDGLTALRIVSETHPHLPFIFVSGTMGEEAAIESLKNGAVDYILKDRLGRLPAALRQAVKNARERAERQQAEERIREQAALIDAARDAIIVCQPEGIITFWNRGAERLYGWTEVEAVGQPTGDLLRAHPAMLKAALKKVLTDGHWAGEMTERTKAGKEVIVQSRWTLNRGPGGEPRSILAINTDITELKQLEAKFLRAQRVETVGALAGGIAHDLNNMLSPILVGVELLRGGLDGPDRDQMLQTMWTSTLRGKEIVRQILSFSRGVGGETTRVQLNQLVGEMARLAQETFPRAIQIQTHMAPDLKPIEGNATQMHQVLLNLCVNARDAMPEGGTLRIETRNVTLKDQQTHWQPVPVSGDYVVLSVTDTGSGIPQKVMDLIFEPFFTTKEVGKGTGLGLSTVQGIVKSHGGFIEVQSEENQGTAFSVFLPKSPHAL